MKFPRLSTLRRSVEEAPLPAALTALLALTLLFQSLLPTAVDLPDVPMRAMKAPELRTAESLPASVPPALAARDIFAPGGGGGGKATAAGSGAITLLGVARSRRGGAAVLRGADGAAVAVPLGGRVGPWRVTGIGAASARIDDGSRSLTLRVGDSTAPSAADGDE
ncbi:MULTISPECIES: hypothetical protein [unclassified Sphingobium]|uniref:hypothetical protein n=1 Tax=unclassified Sphingobium TaxID=2611147 RepID=UPI0035A7104E